MIQEITRELKETALAKAASLNVVPEVIDYVDSEKRERGFVVDLKGANLNLSKEVHNAVQEKAIELQALVSTKLFPGRVIVFEKT
jgi:hypothetical protein